MQITFIPALSDTIHVHAPIGLTTTLLFTAVLTDVDYNTLKRDDGTVQLWSNITSDDMVSPTEDWIAHNFKEALGSSLDLNLLGTGLRSEGGGHDNVELDGQSVLLLQLHVPVTTHEFSFTYRIMYPSGEKRWLGRFGQNGQVFIDHLDENSILGLADGWTRESSGYTWSRRNIKLDEDKVVIRLAKPVEFDFCGLGCRSTNTSPLVLLIPRISGRPVYLPPFYVLCASSDTSISFPFEGCIATSAGGSLLLKMLPHQFNIFELANNIAAYCSSERVEAKVYTEPQNTLIIATKGIYPTYVITMAEHDAMCGPSRLDLSSEKLFALLPNSVASLLLFSPESRAVYFCDADTTNTAVVTFGRTYVLSPMFDLGAAGCQLAVVSPYTSAQIFYSPDEGSGILPTPPLSPQLKPIAHLSGSGIVPGESASSSLSGSILSLSLTQDTYQGRLNGADRVDHRNDDVVGHAVIPTTAMTTTAPQMIFRLNAALARLHHILSSVYVVVMTFTWLLFANFDNPDSDNAEEHESETKGDEKAPEEPGADVNNVNEHKSPLEEKEGEDVRSTDGNRIVERDVVTSQAYLDGSRSLLMEVGAGVVVLVARRVALAGMEGVLIEMNGQRVDFKETGLEGGASLLEFDSAVGGVVKISYTS